MYGSGIVENMINNTDKLDKLVKFFETFFRGFQQLIAVNPVSTAALKVIKQTSSWLTAVQIVGDGEFFINCANHVKKGFLEFSKKTLNVISHLFATLNFAKDCGSAACAWLDKQLGKVAIFGTQLSLKVAKDLAGILSGGIAIAQTFNTILFDRQGRSRTNPLEMLREFMKEESLVSLLNNISKIYILAGVIIGAPYTLATFAMGLILGTTTIMSFGIKYEKEQKEKTKAYINREDLIARIPIEEQKVVFLD
jgi:hypothetical protein